VTQPTFSPVLASGIVRPTMETSTPQFARAPKPGLQRSATSGRGQGTQAPGEGFALTIAQREVAKLDIEHEHDRHDVAVGVGLVAAKRASLVGRAPQLSDVHVAMSLFGLDSTAEIGHSLTKPFAGLAHSYVLQRRFVDAVANEQLVAPTPA
jgi:hypothetical protein